MRNSSLGIFLDGKIGIPCRARSGCAFAPVSARAALRVACNAPLSEVRGLLDLRVPAGRPFGIVRATKVSATPPSRIIFRRRLIAGLALLGLAVPAGAPAQAAEAVSAAYVGTASDIGFYLA